MDKLQNKERYSAHRVSESILITWVSESIVVIPSSIPSTQKLSINIKTVTVAHGMVLKQKNSRAILVERIWRKVHHVVEHLVFAELCDDGFNDWCVKLMSLVLDFKEVPQYRCDFSCLNIFAALNFSDQKPMHSTGSIEDGTK